MDHQVFVPYYAIIIIPTPYRKVHAVGLELTVYLVTHRNEACGIFLRLSTMKACSGITIEYLSFSKFCRLCVVSDRGREIEIDKQTNTDRQAEEKEKDTDRHRQTETDTKCRRTIDIGFVCLFFLTSSSTTRLYRGRAPRQSVWQFYVLPHMRQRWETMTSVSAGHIILTPTQPVGSGRLQRESNPGPPHQESRALPTELPRSPRHRKSGRQAGRPGNRQACRQKDRQKGESREREREWKGRENVREKEKDKKRWHTCIVGIKLYKRRQLFQNISLRLSNSNVCLLLLQELLSPINFGYHKLLSLECDVCVLKPCN